MTESRNRDLATSIGAAVASDNIATDGTLAISGVVTYTNLSDLPSSGVSAGDLGFVTANNGLYIRGTSGWYVIALVNTSPSYTTSPSSSYDLATDGSTTTVITVVATDPEGFAITYSATADNDFNGLATVSQSSNVFTVTPKAEGVATTTSGTLTFRATDGVNNTDVVSTFNLTFSNIIIGNRHTLVLAKASGNNGNNLTFTDASSSSHTITPSGNAQGQTFSPYRSGGYYTNFDGTGDQISVTTPDSTFNFGTGDFTVETWFWIDSASASEPTMFELNTTPYSDSFIVNHRDRYGIAAYLNSSSISGALHGHDDNTMGSEASVASTDWTHLAIVRNGSTITLYLNGKSVSSGSYSTSAQDFTNQSEIIFGGSNNGNFIGKLFDLRIVKGTAVYTANFTPPATFLEKISGTSLLTFRTAVPYDESDNSHALTFAGNPTTLPQTTIYDYFSYSTSNHSGSVYLDGSGDYLTIPWSSDFEFGSGDFTIEMWYNLSDIEGLISWGPDVDNRFDITGTSQTALRVLYNHASHTNFNNGNGVPTANTWQHFACARENDNLRYFINGVLQATVAMSTGAVMPNDSSNGISIGVRRYGTTYADYSIGYISNLRILKGTALYTATFTPPASSLGAITNTKLLAFQGNGLSIFDSSQNTRLIHGTNIKSSTAQTKNASSSIVFDDSGNGLTGEIEALGTGTFTIEGWFYAGAQGSNNRIFTTGGNNNAGGFSLVLRTTGNLQLQGPGGTSLYQSGAYADSAWHHFALVKIDGSTAVTANQFRFFIDGASVYSSASFSTNLTATNLYIGHDNGAYQFGGYIEDFRISKGIARYPFAVLPTTLTSDSNTFLLACHSDSATTAVGDWTVTTPDSSAPTVSNFAPFAGGTSLRFTSNDDMLLFTHTGSSSDYLIGDRNDNAAGNFSIEFWAYYDAASIGSTTYMVSNFGGGAGAASSQTLMLGYRTTGTNLLQYRVNSASGSGTTNSTQITNGATFQTWTHHYIVQEYDSSNSNTYVAYYIDGVRVHNYTKTSNDPLDMQRFVIGSGTGSGSSGGSYWNGYISNFRIQTGTVAFPNTAQLKYTLPTAELEG